MLSNLVRESIVEMKAVKSMENASADTKKQALVDYNFKQFVLSLKVIIQEIDLAVNNSTFRPSSQTMSSLKSFVSSCENVIQSGIVSEEATAYIKMESETTYSVLSTEWSKYYEETTQHTLNLLDTIKEIIPDSNKVKYATNKIRKAASWNKTLENYNYLNKGLEEAKQIVSELELEGTPGILEFLKLVGSGKATIADLNQEILEWIISENLQSKMNIVFSE